MWSECCFSEWEREILLYIDNELPPEGRTRVEHHLGHCNPCGHYYEEQRRIEAELGFDLRLHQRAHPLPLDFDEHIAGTLPRMKMLSLGQRMAIFLEEHWRPDAWWAYTRRHAAVATSLLLLLMVGGGSSLLNLPQARYDVQVIEVAKRAFLQPVGESISNNTSLDIMYRLPDMSHIIAKPNSSFAFDAYQRRGDDRALRMTRGELWCDVLPTEQGFSVTTPHAIVRVIGTRFAVKVSPTETSVDVIEGQVLIEKRDQGYPKTAAVRAGRHSAVPRRGRIQVPSKLDAKRLGEVHSAFERVDEIRALLAAQTSAAERRAMSAEEPRSGPKDPPLIIVPGP